MTLKLQSMTAAPISEIGSQRAVTNLQKPEMRRLATVQKSSREFEAALLAHWLEQAEQSFATVPGDNPDETSDSGREQFQSIAMQAVATEMCVNGPGLGIGPVIARYLQSTPNDDRRP